ncbi:hypothetical protein [Zavarzinella formosa]|uniref:hypothetical protein n=1 Tax=Zavarzinella formosa TaxID=360055 RepID=UPI0002E8E9BE|nr:hypothetical protein [Zavarzinella formosa]
MKNWKTVRRWLVWQALMFWQGGFLFYAAIVVPMGTDELGGFTQGRVTRPVTEWMNLIGLPALLLMAWDQLAAGKSKYRWVCWGIMVSGLAGEFALHPVIGRFVDAAEGELIPQFEVFYWWHRLYLLAATAIWAASLAWTALTLRDYALGTDKAP